MRIRAAYRERHAARIVDATVAAFSPGTLWPVHPRDLDPGDDPPARVPCLYFGAAGVISAARLNAVGGAASLSFSFGDSEPLDAVSRAGASPA